MFSWWQNIKSEQNIFLHNIFIIIIIIIIIIINYYYYLKLVSTSISSSIVVFALTLGSSVAVLLILVRASVVSYAMFVLSLFVSYISRTRNLMNTPNILLLCRRSKRFPKLSSFATWPGAMFDHQWLELPISRTNFHGSFQRCSSHWGWTVYSFSCHFRNEIWVRIYFLTCVLVPTSC